MAQVIQRAAGFTFKQAIKPQVAPSLNLIFTRTHFKEPFTYDLIPYKGSFDGHNPKLNPRRMNPYKEEELLIDIHKMRNMEIHEPSPFHVVRRIKSMGPLPWTQKVTLRRLNLHSSRNGECMIIPNTPQYNDMLMKVKQVITIVPAVFENGRIPTEDDIGAIKVCPYTGKISVDEKLRLNQNREAKEKSLFMRGSKFRYMIGHCRASNNLVNPKGLVS